MRENHNFRDYYEIVKKRGEGLMSTIYEVKIKNTNETRAIKVYDKNNIISKNLVNNNYENAQKEMQKIIDNCLNEIRIMKIVEGINKQNINTIKFYEYFNNEDEFAIVMELSDFSLNSINSQQLIRPQQVLEILTQLNNTFKIISENKIVHRSIGLHNILMSKCNGNIIFKLGSYGFSKQLKNNEKLQEGVGSLYYMSPEILNGEKYDEKTDLWSLGIVIYSLLFKEMPFPVRTSIPSELYKQIKESGLQNLKKSDNSDLNDLIQKLLTIDQNKRINWKEYFEHPFFRKNSRNVIDVNYLQRKLNEEINKNAKLNEKINKLMIELKEEKNKNKILEEKLEEYEREINIKTKNSFSYGNTKMTLNDEKDLKKSLMINTLLDKDNQIKELKLKLSRFPFELNEGEKLITVVFKSSDLIIPHFSIICKNTDIFNVIEKKLYEEYKDYYDSENYFMAKGLRVQKYKSLDENHIYDHDVIILYKLNI